MNHFIVLPTVANMRSATFIICLLTIAKSSSTSETQGRQGKDLVYEAMKMRTGNWRTWDRNRVEIVGGGILEKKMLGERGGVEEYEDPRHESREMQCCDQLEVESFGRVEECHPYALGEYRKIGSCRGKSFYQHKNNTDIFLYHACGAWYIGLETSTQETPSFGSLPQVPPNYPQGYPQYAPGSVTPSTDHRPVSSSVKHEHFHYHYPSGQDGYFGGHHPSIQENSGGRTGIITGNYEIYSRPVHVESKYKHQFKGDPYKKRSQDEPYYPMGKAEITKSTTDKNIENLE